MGAGSAAEVAATIRPVARLRGEVRVPGDKSISHRALILAGLASGASTIHAAGDGADVRSTAGIVAAASSETQASGQARDAQRSRELGG